MLTFREAEKLFATARNKSAGKPLCNNTRLHKRKNWDNDAYYYAVTLHGTDVVEIYKDNQKILNSGGYRTHTTKERINTYGAGRVFQKDFVWYWSPSGSKEIVRFEDGMVVK